MKCHILELMTPHQTNTTNKQKQTNKRTNAFLVCLLDGLCLMSGYVCLYAKHAKKRTSTAPTNKQTNKRRRNLIQTQQKQKNKQQQTTTNKDANTTKLIDLLCCFLQGLHMVLFTKHAHTQAQTNQLTN